MTGNLATLLIAHDSSSELPSLRETILPSSVEVGPVPTGRKNRDNESAGRNRPCTTEEPLTATSLDDALTEIKAGWFPDLVIVYQGVPDEFPQSQIDELIGLLPLARFIIAFGPWCESIGRTEQRWPIAWCVPIRHLPTRLERVMNDSASPTPATASRDEAFSETATQANSAVARGDLTAAVSGDDRHFVETVRDQLTASDFQITDRDPDCVFLSASHLSAQTEARLTQLRIEFPGAGQFLLCDLLTPDQIERLRSAGVIPMSQLRFAEELSAIAVG